MKNALAFWVLLFSALLLPQALWAYPSLTATFYDVGEGDATLITNESNNCRERILVDSGNFLTGAALAKKLSPTLASPLDWLLLTHPHPDHIGGAFSLIAEQYIKSIGDNGQPFSPKELSEGINRWYLKGVRKDPRYHELRAPRRIDLACGGKISVLWPPAGVLSQDWNNNSLVLLVQRGKFRLLLMGDALKETEAALLGDAAFSEPITVLRAGHHGSRSTGDARFLKQLRPKTVVVSVGTPNPYGYPDTAVLERYRAAGTLLRTDEEGTIVIESNEDGTFTVTHGR